MEPLRVAVRAGVGRHAQRIEPRVGAPGTAVVDLDGVDVGCRGAFGGGPVIGGFLGSRQGENAGEAEAEEGEESGGLGGS